MRKTALWMTYLYFFICPLEFIFNVWFGSSVKYIGLIAAAFILMFFIGSRKTPMRIGLIQICIILWAVFEATSYLWTIPSTHGLDRLLTYIMMAVFVFAVSLFPFEKKELEGVLLSCTLGCLVLACLVFAIGEMHGGYNSTGRITLHILNSYLDPNGLAANLLVGIFYSLHQTMKKPKGFPLSNILFGICFVVLTTAAFYTGSRGALVAYAGAALIYLLSRTSAKNRWRILATIPLILILLYFGLSLVLSERTFDRLFDFESYTSGSGRINIWLTALREIVKRPFFGYGVASYFGYFKQVFGTESAMHNTFLLLVFEVGIVGLSLFMVPFFQALRCAKQQKNTLIVAVIFANLIAAFFLDALNWRYLWNAMMFGIIFYNCYHQTKRSATQK